MGIVIDYAKLRTKLIDEYLFEEPNVIRKEKIRTQANKLTEWSIVDEINKKNPQPAVLGQGD